MQPFVLYNSEQRKKVEFVPRKEGHIDMYVCGMTVYDYCHIGHARVMVAFDYIIRFLRSQGWNVKYVRNITDIDDKIIKRANENGESITALTDRFIQAMNDDAANLGCVAPDEAPRATDYIDQMQNMIGTLVNKGTAYPSNNGDVYFEVEKFAKYGRLSGRKLEDMQAGASERVDVEVEKKHPFDFVLWKHAKENEPSWASPWGNGRPGWHIECSAMSTCCLGNHFDIHGGGSDLTFPHHENEIAQSEASTGEQYVNYWMHVGFINVDGEKMSKSLGNFFTIRDVMEKFHPEVIRYFIVSSHYRSPVNFSDFALKEAKNALTRLYHTQKCILEIHNQFLWDFISIDSRSREYKQVYSGKPKTLLLNFKESMNDDFNTPKALAILFELSKTIKLLRNRITHDQLSNSKEILMEFKAFSSVFQNITKTLNICSKNPRKIKNFLESDIGQEALSLTEAQIEDLIQQRQDAKKAKEFAKADEIRQSLLDQGVVLEDTRQGTIWRRAD